MADEHVGELVAWYANGTLDPEDRRRVERHVDGCEDCRWLLRTAELEQEGDRWIDAQRADEHVSSILLVQYSERPDELAPATREWIEHRVATCPTCREALELLHDVPEHVDTPAPNPFARLWTRLAETMLSPVPALAYLVLIAVGLFAWQPWRTTDPAAPLAWVPTLTVTPESVVRDVEPGVEQRLTIDAGRQAVALRLVTEIPSGDVRDGLELSWELRRGDTSLATAPIDPADFDLNGPTAALVVVLSPGALERTEEHAIVLRVNRPGTLLHERELFRRRFVVLDDEAEGETR